MKGKQNLIYALNSGYSFFYVQTFEMQKSVEEITDICESYKRTSDGEQMWFPKVWDFDSSPDPDSCVDMLDKTDSYTVVIAKNFNWFLKDEYGSVNKDIASFLQNRAELFTTIEYRKILIVVGDESFGSAIPSALDKDFMPFEFGLPEQEEIAGIYDFIVDSAKDNPKFKEPAKKEKEAIIASSRGMTARAVKNALSYSILDGKGEMSSKAVSKIRAEVIEGTAGLKTADFSKMSFDDLKGMDNVKEFFLSTFDSKLSLGLLLLGPPGTGKTLFAQCASGESGLDVYEAEMSELFGGLVGDSEKLMKTFIETISKLTPCILFCDELEKALAGVGGGSQSDGGTTQRSMAQFLKFLSDKRPEGLYVIATCNNVKQLPPEWVRAERWDCAPFFIDIPNDEEREMILEHYQSKYSVKGQPKNMEGWSGAEIKSSCRIASMMGKKVNEVERFVIPVAKTMQEQIEGLRGWAENKTIPATTQVPKGGRKKIGKRKIEM